MNMREIIRYYPASSTEAIFISHNTDQPDIAAVSWHIWDISEKGCSFETEEVNDFKTGQTGALKIKRGFHADVIPNVRIEHTRDNGMMVSFEPTNRITKYIGH